MLPTDMFVLVFLALGVAGASAATTSSATAVAVFTLVWMTSAITRVSELRRGGRPAIRLNELDRRQAVAFAIGSGTWIVLGILQTTYASWIVWKPIEVPFPLKALGVVLAAGVIAEPFLLRLRRSPKTMHGCLTGGSTPPEYRSSASLMIRSGAILLLSGSPVFALMCALWLSITLWPSAAAAAQGWRIPSSPSFNGGTGYVDRVDNAIPAPLT